MKNKKISQKNFNSSIEIDSIADSEERETCSDIDSIGTNNIPLRASIENIPDFRHVPFETTSTVVIDSNKANNKNEKQQFVIVSKKNYEAPQPPQQLTCNKRAASDLHEKVYFLKLLIYTKIIKIF